MNRRVFVANNLLSLVEHKNSDDRALYENWQDPATQRGYNFIRHEDFDEYTSREIKQRFFAMIRLNSTDEIIGAVGISPPESTADLAIWLFNPYRRQGYGTNAFALATEYAVKSLNIKELHAGAYPDNIGSLKMLRKCGYIPYPEGNVIEKHYLTGADVVQYDFIYKKGDDVNLFNGIGNYAQHARFWDWGGYERTEEHERWLKMAQTHGKNVLIPMCATGETGAYMAERGMNVTAFDVTPEMIDEGKKRFGDLSGLRLYEGDIRSFRFDIPHVDFCYCTDFGHIHSIEEVKKALACINTHLRDGGCLVVETGLRLLDAKSHYTPTETFYPQKQVYPGIKVWKTGETRNDGETGRTYISQIFYAENESGNVESFNHAFYMQLYYREEWLAAFKECGFDIATESDNSGYHSFEAVKSAAEKEQESPTVGFPLMDFRHDPIDIATDRDYVLERHCRINYECDTPWARKLAYAQYRANWFVDTGQQKLGYYRYRYEYEKVLRQDNKNG